MRKLLILEINEVPFKIYDHFITKYPESTLATIANHSKQYVTKTTDQGELHPWSTWPTLYRGVDNTEHSIKDIGEDLSEIDEKYPAVWKTLTRKDIKCGIFGSLHTYPLDSNLANYNFLIPDPFANGDDTYPIEAKPFQSFNLAMSRKSGRSVDKGIDKKSALKLILKLPQLGVKLTTIGKVIKQLIDERVSPWKANRRRTFQSVLAFDIFLKLLKKNKPHFTTFFSNHVASAMHRYWAATFPEEYEENELPEEWINTYQNEIEYCLWQLDDMLKEIVSFVHKYKEYKLVIASSMGQEATSATLIKHELFLGDFEKLMTVLGVKDGEQLSAMHPQYNFKVSEDQINSTESTLSKFIINDNPITYRRKGNSFSLDLGYPNIENFDLKIDGKKGLLSDLGLEVRKIDDQSGGTAYHIPEGSLFIYDPQEKNTPTRKQVDLRSVAPSILNYFGIKPPKYMKEESIFS